MIAGLREKDRVLWWDQIAFIPSIHGRVAFAREVRRVFLDGRFPTVAVELPESLAEKVLEAVDRLPWIHAVSYEEEGGERCFFPVDPCDSIVEALRLGIGENCSLEFIDCDTEEYQRVDFALPDSYAVDSIGLPSFYGAVEPSLPQVEAGSQDDLRERIMAQRLKKILEGRGPRLPVLCVLGMAHLRGVVRYLDGPEEELAEEVPGALPPFQVDLHQISARSLYHILGELPYTTHLYEKERRAITLEQFEAVDKMKELLLEARERYHRRHREEYERISLASFQNILQLTRNLCLLQQRLTPSLYEMAVAAKGAVGSEFAMDVIEIARRYPAVSGEEEREGEREGDQGSEAGAGTGTDTPGTVEEEGQDGEGVAPGVARMTEDAMSFGGGSYPAKKRFVDEPKVWKKLNLEPPPPPSEVRRWKTAWNPLQTCSWTPEDILIENFAGHVRSRALLECGIAQEHLEEFSTSFKDGIHIRETIRNLHLGKIMVKETPPVQGQVGAVVIIYEKPDPEKFPWKVTWLPEFEWESILAFYATDFRKNMVGPGIARATYGGQIFLKDKRYVGDVWEDPGLEEARDDGERLVFAAVAHSTDAYLAYLASSPPNQRMKEYARRHGKRIVYLPLSSFSRTTLSRLRRFHVLNGKPVRSYASQFIR